MSEKSKKRKKKSHASLRFVLTFSLTLTVVLLAGAAGMIAYGYVIRINQEDPPDSIMEYIAAEVISMDSVMDQGSPREDSRYADILADTDYMTENRIYVKEPVVSGEVRLCFGGDILFDSNYAVMASAGQRGGTVEQAFSRELLEQMRMADIMMLNNEFAYTTGGTPVEGKQYTFRALPETASWLKDMGADIVSLANNHTFDFGEVGLLDTLNTLREIQMPYAGAGETIEEASAPVYFIVDDIKIGIVAATQIERLDHPDTRGADKEQSGVFRSWDPSQLLEVVAEAKENSDFVIVYIHWGTENVSEPDWVQIDHAPQIAAAGADLIVGTHPHCLQGITYSQEVPVAYSLGNFWFNSRQVDTGMLEVILNENGIKSVRFIPAVQKDCFTSLLFGKEKEDVLESLRELSPNIVIDMEGYITVK